MPLFALGGTGDVGRRTGMILTIGAIGAMAGPPMSGAINKATGGFTFVGVTAGTWPLFFFVFLG
jgi:MFS transporter, MCT family, solute carrier family 16 (monocarboxylic acid transporters), member 10